MGHCGGEELWRRRQMGRLEWFRHAGASVK
jgi:hypothetical protein